MIGTSVCDIFRIPCACPYCVAQLDKYWLPNCALSYQPRYDHVENFECNKLLELLNGWITVEFLYNKTPTKELGNTNALLLAGI